MPKSFFVISASAYGLCAFARTIQLLIVNWDIDAPVGVLIGESIAEGLIWPVTLTSLLI